MHRPVRMFAIVEQLRGARAAVPARNLAQALSVATRTIYRDIAALQELHVPIHGERGIGYTLGPGFDLPPLMFSASELEAVRLGLAMSSRTADVELARAASAAAAKIRSAVVGHAFAREWSDIQLFASDYHAIPDSRIEGHDLRRYVRESRRLDITYRDGAGTLSERRISPIALVYYVDSVVLASWCDLREDFRHFRVDRLESCTPDGGRFTKRAADLRGEWREAREGEVADRARANAG